MVENRNNNNMEIEKVDFNRNQKNLRTLMKSGSSKIEPKFKFIGNLNNKNMGIEKVDFNTGQKNLRTLMKSRSSKIMKFKVYSFN